MAIPPPYSFAFFAILLHSRAAQDVASRQHLEKSNNAMIMPRKRIRFIKHLI